MSDDVMRYGQVDPAVESRVQEVLARMTLEEKVGQLVQAHPYIQLTGGEAPEPAQAGDVDWAEPARPSVRPEFEAMICSGRVGSIFGSPDPEIVNHCQRLAVEKSRLGIPLMVGNDVIHGFRTIFPIPLAESCTWNPVLLERAARAAAEEASAVGTDWIFAPMVDVARDPRWGRIAEGAGEDPFLGAAMARARVRGFQSADLRTGRRVASCPKHFVGYGAAEAGRDYNTVDVSERTLRDVYLPPFQAALDAGAGSLMSSFNEIAGIPATCNSMMLRTILRDEWQWEGMVVSDYEAVRELIPHGVADDLTDAARLSIRAGLDMDMMSFAYARHLAGLVEAGDVPVSEVDDAVRRVLRLKAQLGLFDHPFVDESRVAEMTLRDETRALALEVARESMVLLKNDRSLLPLSANAQRIALLGPLADNRSDLLGTWALHGRAEDVDTVLEGMSAFVDDPARLRFLTGCSVDGDDHEDIPAAADAAREADVVVVVVGEGAAMSGEAHSRAHLGLPGPQQDLVDAVAASGKPLVVVLMSGRPLVIPRLAEQADALLVAWHGGIRAGRAVAEILFGAAGPSGKLTASWPRAEGQIPVYYAHKNTGRPIGGEGTRQFEEPYRSTYVDVPNAPLFPFGFGLSYTTFAYRDLAVQPPVARLDGVVRVSAVVENTGNRVGDEVVQLYVRDEVASVTRPVKELKGFQRLRLEPGEARSVCFDLPVSDLGFRGVDMRYTVEPGTFRVWVGPDSSGGLEGAFEVRSGADPSG